MPPRPAARLRRRRPGDRDRGLRDRADAQPGARDGHPTGADEGPRRRPDAGTRARPFTTAWGSGLGRAAGRLPVPAGAEPASPGDPAEGPVSGAFVTSRAPDEVATLMQNALAGAGYSTNTLSGPAEDGSLVIDSAGGGGDPACRVQTRVRPLGGTTMITVLFAAACPWG